MATPHDRFRLHAPITGLWLAVLSGGLTAASIPKVDWWPLAWVSLVPVLVAIHAAPHRARWLGLVFGFVAGLGKVYWITGTLVQYGGLNMVLGVFSMSLVALFLGLYPAAFCILLARADWRAARFPIVAAAIWTALELVQSVLLTGFPWELLGYSQYRALPVIQVARLTGVYGVSFLIVLVNATIAMLVIAGRKTAGMTGRSAGMAASITTLAIAGTLVYGYSILSATQSRQASVQPLTVVVVQGSISQDLKWSEKLIQQTVTIYDNLTRRTLAQHPEFIVFPETALTFYPESPVYAALTNQVYRLADDAQAPILTGGLGYDPGKSKVIYNSAFLIVPDGRIAGRYSKTHLVLGGRIVGRYSKMHLVPFGEYLPLPWLFSFLSRLTEDIGVFTPGRDLSVMTLPGRDVRFGTVICYESIFPDLVRQFVKRGANVLIVMTNDAWFGTSSAPAQHFSMAVLRAVENRVPIIRAANTGISGFITATGRMSGRTPLFAPTSTMERIRPGSGAITFYTRYGDVFAYVCCVVGMMVVFDRIRGGRRK